VIKGAEWKRYLLLGLSLGKILKKGLDMVKLYIEFIQLTMCGKHELHALIGVYQKFIAFLDPHLDVVCQLKSFLELLEL
jgi:hypothetical protein